jgi:phage I-like protein
VNDALSSLPGAKDVTRREPAVALCATAGPRAAVAFGVGVALAFAAGGTPAAPEWIQIFPAGPKIEARDGRTWTLENPSVLIDAFAENGAFLPLDVEHATELLAPNGHEAPAVAWIQQLEVREGGTTWAKPDWTRRGLELIADRSYVYVSPAFTYDQVTGAITRLKSVALTTQPALGLPAIAREQSQTEPPPMSLSARLRDVFGLAADAADDAIVAAASERVALAREARDPAKLVPAADHQAALARATTAETALAQRLADDKETAVTGAVDEAVAEGRIQPAAKPHWLAVARADIAAFKAAVATMPAVKGVGPAGKTRDAAADDAATHGLTTQQLAICASQGIDPVAFAAELKKG